MLDLGKYAGAVMSSWIISLGLIAALIIVSVMQARKAKERLEAAENRRKGA